MFLLLALSAVAAPHAKAASANVTIGWSANPLSEQVVQYRVNYGTAPNTGNPILTTATTIKLSALRINTTYYVNVRAVNAQGLQSQAAKLQFNIGKNGRVR